MAAKTLIQAIHGSILDEMRRDDRVVVLGEDVGARGGVLRATLGLLD
jgi:pyruvate/2-oxoglutarate/acetoin dehydrogenase E1 component